MTSWNLRSARPADINALVALEEACFDMDRLSKRQFKWMIEKANADLIVAEIGQQIMAYALILFHRGTSLARLYSIAISSEARGIGLSDALMEEVERVGQEHNCIYMRLEVHPKNLVAIKLYERHGYYRFGELVDYYEDHSDALRFEKRIHTLPENVPHDVPFYAQSMAFTCGPASLMMAMQAHQGKSQANDKSQRQLEVQLWREATTIYMTSGHGGCSPQGLALAAWNRGFGVELIVSHKTPLFLDGVRKADKKEVMQLVHDDFASEIAKTAIKVQYRGLDIKTLLKCIEAGGIPLILISSYRFNSSKAPHWVVLAAADSHFIYLHDPDVDTEEHRTAADNMFIPVDYAQFERMTHFGQARSQAAVIVYPQRSK